MNATERMQHILMADPTKLAQIDAILNGNGSSSANAEETRLITISEAGKRLGLSRPTVYRLVETRRLDAVELNGVPRIRLQSVFDFAAGKRPANEATAQLLVAAQAKRHERHIGI